MIALPKTKRSPKLTVLSFGAGQDSTAILYALVEDKKFREHYAPNDLLVVCSDTGDEFPLTYLHIMSVERYCEENGIEFVHITSGLGFHTPAWRSLQHQYRLNSTVGSKRFKKTCTVNLKINPIYKFLNRWVSRKYGFHEYGTVYKGKHALVQFAEKHGQIDVLIGIARGEEERIDTSGKDVNVGRWFRVAVNRVYPLVDVGMDRLDCQNYIRALGRTVPPPSNCMRCPFVTKPELLYLARKFPNEFQEWVEFEAAKLHKFRHKGKNNVGVFGGLKTLPTILREAEAQYGHWSLEQLEEYRFSHGHCVRSKY